MSILLTLLLAQAPVLPEVDRRALDLQARAEALLSRRAVATHPSEPQPRRTVTQAAAPAPAVTQRVAATRRASGGVLNLSSITTICRAAGGQGDPASFLATLSRAYSLSAPESASLRTSCAAYLAGRADARSSNYRGPAH